MKKINIISTLALAIIAIALTACASIGRESKSINRGTSEPKAELVIELKTKYGGLEVLEISKDYNTVKYLLINPKPSSDGWYEGTYTFRLPNGLYSVWCGPRFNVGLNNNRARVKIVDRKETVIMEPLGNRSVVTAAGLPKMRTSPASEIVLDVGGLWSENSDMQNQIPRYVKVVSGGNVVFPPQGGLYEVEGELQSRSSWKGRVTIPVPNGKFNVYCTTSPDVVGEYSAQIELIYNRARMSCNYSSGDKGVSAALLRGEMDSIDPAMFKRIDSSAVGVFRELNTALSKSLKQDAVIALLPVTSPSEDYKNHAWEKLAAQFINTKKYKVIEKSRTESLLNESLSGGKPLSELLEADAVIFSSLDDEGNINAWAIDPVARTLLAKTPLKVPARRPLPRIIPPLPSPKEGMGGSARDYYANYLSSATGSRSYSASQSAIESKQAEMDNEAYESELKWWTEQAMAIKNAHPDAAFPPRPTDDNRNKYMLNSYSKLRDAQKAWDEAQKKYSYAMVLLPFSGGTGSEMSIFTYLLSKNPDVSKNYIIINDFSANAAYAQYGLLTPLTDAQKEQLGRYGNMIVTGTFQQLGNRNILTLRTYNINRNRNRTMDIEYKDVLDLCMKFDAANVLSIMDR